MQGNSLRVYGGVDGGTRQGERWERFIETGLTLLGSAEGGQPPSVRGICRHAGLAARYFYESFAGRDSFAIAVFDHVVDDLAASTLEAVHAAPTNSHDKIYAGLHNIVDRIGQDPRRGRLLFSPALNATVLWERRMESTQMFAQLLGSEASELYRINDSTRLKLLTEFLVGGLAQALTSWLNGTLDLSAANIVERCTEYFLTIDEIR